MTYTYNLSSLHQAADAVLANLRSKVLLFYGEMGTGKTTLIKELVKQLGATDNVSSPTFSLVNEYDADAGKLYHFDFYRINSETEALDMGVEEYFYSGNHCFVEWPEKISGLLPENADTVYLTINKDGTRNLKLNADE